VDKLLFTTLDDIPKKLTTLLDKLTGEIALFVETPVKRKLPYSTDDIKLLVPSTTAAFTTKDGAAALDLLKTTVVGLSNVTLALTFCPLAVCSFVVVHP
jgi:hypothetical protein